MLLLIGSSAAARASWQQPWWSPRGPSEAHGAEAMVVALRNLDVKVKAVEWGPIFSMGKRAQQQVQWLMVVKYVHMPVAASWP